MQTSVKINNLLELPQITEYYIYFVSVRWEKNKAGKTIRTVKNVKLTEYPYPSEFTSNNYPVNWVNPETGQKYYETYCDGDEFTDGSGYAQYYYIFPMDQFCKNKAEALIFSDFPKLHGFNLYC